MVGSKVQIHGIELDILRQYPTKEEQDIQVELTQRNMAHYFKVTAAGFLFDFYLPELDVLWSIGSLHDHSERYWEEDRKRESIESLGLHWEQITSLSDSQFLVEKH